MIDDRPYIIVDNRKIAPIQPSPRVGRPAGDRKKSDEHPFGVVDRVTISNEARERLRLRNVSTTQRSTIHTDRSDDTRVPPSHLLTYSPGQKP
jgi:hypothetical protein